MRRSSRSRLRTSAGWRALDTLNLLIFGLFVAALFVLWPSRWSTSEDHAGPLSATSGETDHASMLTQTARAASQTIPVDAAGPTPLPPDTDDEAASTEATGTAIAAATTPAPSTQAHQAAEARRVAEAQRLARAEQSARSAAEAVRQARPDTPVAVAATRSDTGNAAIAPTPTDNAAAARAAAIDAEVQRLAALRIAEAERRLAAETEKLTQARERLAQAERAAETQRRAALASIAEAQKRATREHSAQTERLARAEQQALASAARASRAENAAMQQVALAANPPSPQAPAPHFDCSRLDRGYDLPFGNDNRQVPARVNRTLRAIASCIRADRGRYEIGGHTDNLGDPQNNLLLSVRRAQSAARILVSMGVEKKELRVRGYGQSQPAADNFTASGRARNRRISVMRLKS